MRASRSQFPVAPFRLILIIDKFITQDHRYNHIYPALAHTWRATSLSLPRTFVTRAIWTSQEYEAAKYSPIRLLCWSSSYFCPQCSWTAHNDWFICLRPWLWAGLRVTIPRNGGQLGRSPAWVKTKYTRSSFCYWPAALSVGAVSSAHHADTCRFPCSTYPHLVLVASADGHCKTCPPVPSPAPFGFDHWHRDPYWTVQPLRVVWCTGHDVCGVWLLFVDECSCSLKPCLVSDCILQVILLSFIRCCSISSRFTLRAMCCLNTTFV